MHILDGVCQFSEVVFPKHQELFEQLGQGQKPHTMMITCSDSRIDPNLMTQTQPGELFVLRNAGNIVPAFGASNGGEESAIEFAIEGLGVENIVICGHSKCGAMAALSGGVDMAALPSTKAWLEHARATKWCMADISDHGLNDYIEQNVVVQAQNLLTHPSVAAAVKRNRLKIFGMVYHIENGDVKVYSTQKKEFVDARKVDREDQTMAHLNFV